MAITALFTVDRNGKKYNYPLKSEWTDCCGTSKRWDVS